MEQGPEQQEGATFEEVLDAFRSGDPDRYTKFEAWEQNRMRENDAEGSIGRLTRVVETIEVRAADGDRDAFILEYAAAELALGSDQSLSEEVRGEFADRIARAMQEVM